VAVVATPSSRPTQPHPGVRDGDCASSPACIPAGSLTCSPDSDRQSPAPRTHIRGAKRLAKQLPTMQVGSARRRGQPPWRARGASSIGRRAVAWPSGRSAPTSRPSRLMVIACSSIGSVRAASRGRMRKSTSGRATSLKRPGFAPLVRPRVPEVRGVPPPLPPGARPRPCTGSHRRRESCLDVDDLGTRGADGAAGLRSRRSARRPRAAVRRPLAVEGSPCPRPSRLRVGCCGCGRSAAGP
jgi:hypothetical protein